MVWTNQIPGQDTLHFTMVSHAISSSVPQLSSRTHRLRGQGKSARHAQILQGMLTVLPAWLAMHNSACHTAEARLVTRSKALDEGLKEGNGQGGAALIYRDSCVTKGKAKILCSPPTFPIRQRKGCEWQQRSLELGTRPRVLKYSQQHIWLQPPSGVHLEEPCLFLSTSHLQS